MKRTVLLALGAALASAPATAAQPVYQWSGLYCGAQAGYAAANASEGRHSMPGVVYWDRGAEGATAGVFLGYNRLFAGSWQAASRSRETGPISPTATIPI